MRTLLHELIGSPLFTGDEKTIEPPADLRFRELASAGEKRMLMTGTLPNVVSPAVRTPAPAIAEKPRTQDLQFDEAHPLNLRVTGLFMPERSEDFQKLMRQFPEAKLLKMDFKTAKAKIAVAKDSDLFRNAKPEQIVERLNNRIRQLSNGTLGLRVPGAISEGKLQHVEIPIVGLDCMACSMAAYESLMRVEGVERATASFRDGIAAAWFDPAKTNRTVLEEALKKRGVQLKIP